MREMLILKNFKNLKEAMKKGRELEVANPTACGAPNSYMKVVFLAFSTFNATHMINQSSDLAFNAFNQQANYKPRGAFSRIHTSTV